MDKALSPTRGDRMMRLFQRHAMRAREYGMSRQLIQDEQLSGDLIVLDGKPLINFGLCSYLGLGDDERLKEGARLALDHYGSSYSSSIAYTAVPLYGELRECFQEIFDASVVIAPTTTLAHFSALPVLVRPGDLAIVDAMAHASVQTATQLLQANGIPIETVPHNDIDALERTIETAETEGRIWLLVDGVYSVHGDMAPAAELTEMLERHPNLHVYCDDAHGFGWDGLHGRGAYLARSGWHDRLVMVVGLAKAFGSAGGVVAMRSPELADLIDLTGPPLTFGGPIPPPTLGAAVVSAHIHLSSELEELQGALKERIDLVNRLATDMRVPLTALEPTPIWYLDLGDYETMAKVFLAMREDGFFLNAAAFPVVPHGHAGLRFTITLHNSPAHIEEMLSRLQVRILEITGETEIEIDLTEDVPVVRKPTRP